MFDGSSNLALRPSASKEAPCQRVSGGKSHCAAPPTQPSPEDVGGRNKRGAKPSPDFGGGLGGGAANSMRTCPALAFPESRRYCPAHERTERNLVRIPPCRCRGEDRIGARGL